MKTSLHQASAGAAGYQVCGGGGAVASLSGFVFQPNEADPFGAFCEIENLRPLSQNLYAQAFIACWTRKEAYVKARGDGLAGGMDECSVLQGSERMTGTRDPGELRDKQHWCFHELRPTPGYIGALVIERSGWRLSQRELGVR